MTAPPVQPTRLVLVGDPVAQSLSPLFQNAALRAAGLPVRYELLHTPPPLLAHAITQLRHERAAGNVTVPHKEAFAAQCDQLTAVARRVGSVNTFWCVDDTLVGDNTDVAGAAAALHALAGDALAGAGCLVLGAGGSAAAVLAALFDAGVAEVTMHARSADRAAALASRFDGRITVAHEQPSVLASFDLVVNTTPVGMNSDESPIDVHALPAHACVFDLVYRAGGTMLVRTARARGLRADDGLRMLVEQGACAFERWFGRAPDRDAMWASLAGVAR